MTAQHPADLTRIAQVITANRWRLARAWQQAETVEPDVAEQLLTSTHVNVAREIADALLLDRRPFAPDPVDATPAVVHRPHLERNLGTKTSWCIAWCDCGWGGLRCDGWRTCIPDALREYRQHVETPDAS